MEDLLRRRDPDRSRRVRFRARQHDVHLVLDGERVAAVVLFFEQQVYSAKELVETKYKTLSLSSLLTERCRESHVMAMLRENNDTTLHTSDQPPYIIDTNN